MIPQYVKNELIKDPEIFAFYNDSVKDFLKKETPLYLADKYEFSISNIFLSFAFISNVKNFLLTYNKKIYKEKIIGYKNIELKTLTMNYSLKTPLYELEIFTDSVPRKLFSKKFQHLFKKALEEDIENGIKLMFYRHSKDYGLDDLDKKQRMEKLEDLCTESCEPFQYSYDFISLFEMLKSRFKKYKITGRMVPAIQKNNIVTGLYYQFITQSSFFGFFRNVQYHQVILRYIGQ
jgi:hypothetical protein